MDKSIVSHFYFFKKNYMFKTFFFSPATTLLLNIEQYLSSLDSYVKPPLKALHSFMPRVENELRSLREDLTSLNSSVNSKLDSNMYSSQETHTQQINALNSKLDKLTATTIQLSTEHQNLQTDISDVECTDSEESLELYESMQNSLTQQLENIQSVVNDIRGPYTCGGTGGWRRVVYLDMADSCTPVPLAGNSLDTPREHVAGSVLDSIPVTQPGSLSVEESTPECVAGSRLTSGEGLWHSMCITME